MLGLYYYFVLDSVFAFVFMWTVDMSQRAMPLYILALQ